MSTTSEAAQAEISQLQQRRMDGTMTDHEWRTRAEPRIMELSGMAQVERDLAAAPSYLRPAMLNDMQTRAEESKVTAAIGGNPLPTSPFSYQLDQSPKPTADENELNSLFRQAAWEAKMPTTIAQELWSAWATAGAERSSVDRQAAADGVDGREDHDIITNQHGAAWAKREGDRLQESTQLLDQMRSELRGSAPALINLLYQDRELTTHPAVNAALLHWAQYRRAAGRR